MKHRLFAVEVKLCITFFVLALSLCACSSSDAVRATVGQDSYSYGEMNGVLKGRHANVELKSGKKVSAKEIAIVGDSVSWIDARTDEQFIASIQQLDKVVVKNHALGALEGLGFGLLGGAAGGLIVAEATVSKGHELEGLGGLVVFISGTAIGTFVGTIAGAIIGHSHNYEFQSTNQNDSTRIDKKTAVLYLKNGSIVTGEILSELRDGKSVIRVTIRCIDGKVRTYDDSEIKYIEKESN